MHNTEKTLHRTTIIGGALAIAGGVTFAFGVLYGQALSPGVGLIVIGCQLAILDRVTTVIRETHGPSKVMFDRGFEMGSNKGYQEGRRAARPVLVPINDRDQAFFSG